MMELQDSKQQRKRSNQKSPHSRGNFSKCGKLCDQNFYLEGADLNLSYKKIQIEVSPKRSPRQSTTAFTSVPRQKSQNLRFSIPQFNGQFHHKPNHMYVRSKSPTWSFPKKERYGTQKITQFQICKRHPIIKQQQKQQNQIMYQSTSSIKTSCKNNVNIYKSLKKSASMSMNDTMDETKNYSLLLPRKTSAIDFFSKTKIKNPFYLTRAQVLNQQQKLQGKKDIEPCPKGYIQFYKKRDRQQNKIVKGFQTYLPNYNHQKQFNNFYMTQHPTSPQHHIDFDAHLDRNFEARQTKCPNFQPSKIDFARVSQKNIDLNLKKFRDKIKTRFDRSQPEPNTRLDYDVPKHSLSGMVKMQKVLSRPLQLFPIVDPAIKKAGDDEAKKVLRASIPIKQINEAMRPKCSTKVQI